MRQIAMLILLIACAGLGACQTLVPSSSDDPEYPLPECKNGAAKGCFVQLFKDDDAIQRRDATSLPAHYLELGNPAVREFDCKKIVDPDCAERLERLAKLYFQDGVRPESEIGLALEGGGNKSAPFAMGVMAGLVEEDALFHKVTAISSVSGGTYAASFYFNRLLDVQSNYPQAGTPAQWFASCIPDYFLFPEARTDDFYPARFFEPLISAYGLQAADVSKGLPRCGETLYRASVERNLNEFAKAYEFQGHVWKYHDLIMDDFDNTLSVQKIHTAQYGETLALFAASIISSPFGFFTRSLFRWPVNSAPTKQRYRDGLEREYGASPYVWCYRQNPEKCPSGGHAFDHKRLLQELEAIETDDSVSGHMWIINATAVGQLDGTSWFHSQERDPVRHTFELTPTKFGSGVYGYALASPRDGFDLANFFNPPPLSITGAVVTSGAFFDDDETSWDAGPKRFLSSAAEHFTNVTWFAEDLNFNVGAETRRNELMRPYPLYFDYKGRETPFIHLQDGGNAEDTGVFSLLRRGYKRIILANSSQDKDADFSDLCHLKNQFELEGVYRMDSPDLERIAIAKGARQDSIPGAQTYLDQLCTEQISASDLKVFDDNEATSDPAARTAAARLICTRYHPGQSWKPDVVRTKPCEELKLFQSGHFKSVPKRYIEQRDLFHHLSGDPIVFLLSRDLISDVDPPSESNVVSTIVVLTPTLDWNDFAKQVSLPPSISNWSTFCSTSDRSPSRVNSCVGPRNAAYMAPGATKEPNLPCNVVGYLLTRSCEGSPKFPQDATAETTWHSDYVEYAAYFDLGRNQLWRAVNTIRSWEGQQIAKPVAQ